MKILTVSHFRRKLLIAVYSLLLFIATVSALELMYKETDIEEVVIATESSNKAKEIKIEQIIQPQIKDTKVKIKEYENMPKDIKGHSIIGKLEIPKIKLLTYIIGETTEETLNLSVTKLTGPNINREGNFCITGHNYNNNRMFGKLKKLDIGDKIILTDTYNRSVTYTVSSIGKVDAKELEVLSQETKGEREVTLITCTAGAIKRIVVKAIEEYD